MQRTYSLKKNAQFKYVYRRGASAGAREMVMLYVRGPVLKVGFSVGKKLGCAVQRNRIKRQVRMMVDEIFDFHEDFDTVLIVRPKYDSENYLNNKKSLERLKKKVKMI